MNVDNTRDTNASIRRAVLNKHGIQAHEPNEVLYVALVTQGHSLGSLWKTSKDPVQCYSVKPLATY